MEHGDGGGGGRDAALSVNKLDATRARRFVKQSIVIVVGTASAPATLS